MLHEKFNQDLQTYFCKKTIDSREIKSLFTLEIIY